MDAIKCPTQCIFIEKNGSSKSPAPYKIPYNENSTRAFSKKHRIYVLRDFLLRNYPSLTSSSCTVLDVAGGKGDFSWILRNVDGLDSIIADPRTPNHRRLVKSVHFLVNHPEEAKIRSVEGLPTHQPLAKLVPRLLSNHGIATSEISPGMSDNDFQNIITSPKFMRIHVDNKLIEALRKVGDDDFRVWDEYWEGERRRIRSNNVYYGGTAPKTATGQMNYTENSQITDSRLALKIFQSLDFIVGFHPDQATEASVDLALMLGIPFVVVPCCVFPSDFPERTLNGKRVKTHGELLDYLCMKHHKIRREKLPFVETDTAKNVALYMLEEDIQRSRPDWNQLRLTIFSPGLNTRDGIFRRGNKYYVLISALAPKDAVWGAKIYRESHNSPTFLECFYSPDTDIEQLDQTTWLQSVEAEISGAIAEQCKIFPSNTHESIC